ncbi:type II toxin-antitoxin system HipA family toxin [Leeia oryzae]|uniref:type II toxin-antitoxin system HipA family toxin n=1 Tax=Leeia oryzae TaxID=356662 RepID=UPI00037C19EB|nr:HipA domain-containing protein [Leeia oryzae]
MTTSKSPAKAYVWTWLPGEVAPVVAGVIEQTGPIMQFMYGRSYLFRNNAIPLYEPELPLKTGWQPLQSGQPMPGCIRDASPDTWGRRVQLNQRYSHFNHASLNQCPDLSELEYLLESGSDRIGALDFQASAKTYTPRQQQTASLEKLLQAADYVSSGEPLTPELALALQHATAVGGARPKALFDADGHKYIAKFPTVTDTFNVVKAEYVTMRLAQLAGLSVAPVKLVEVMKQDVLLVERLDRYRSAQGWCRKSMVSALTLMGLNEQDAQYSSYETLADKLRARGTSPKKTLKELFSRLVFNILCGNTDDHARNHAVFWDGSQLTLTPAFDICPQLRAGQEASQAMRIVGHSNRSKLVTAIAFARTKCNLSATTSRQIIQHQLTVIEAHWRQICTEANLSDTDRMKLWGTTILNPFAFTDLEQDDDIVHAASRIRITANGW